MGLVLQLIVHLVLLPSQLIDERLVSPCRQYSSKVYPVKLRDWGKGGCSAELKIVVLLFKDQVLRLCLRLELARLLLDPHVLFTSMKLGVFSGPINRNLTVNKRSSELVATLRCNCFDRTLSLNLLLF